MTINTFNPRKLLHSKWTAVAPQRKEKHFLVIACHLDEDENLVDIDLEAVMTRRLQRLPWRQMQNGAVWAQGWK